MFRNLPPAVLSDYRSLTRSRINIPLDDIHAASELLAEQHGLDVASLTLSLIRYDDFRIQNMRDLREQSQRDYDAVQSANAFRAGRIIGIA